MKIKDNIKLSIMCIIIPFALGWAIFRGSYPDLYVKLYYIFIIAALYSLIYPKGGKIIYKTAGKTGEFIGKYLAIAVLTIVYVIAVIPTGVLMKIVKRDRLRLKKPNLSSYWINYEKSNTDYEYQF